jgi:hypothetical protein
MAPRPHGNKHGTSASVGQGSLAPFTVGLGMRKQPNGPRQEPRQAHEQGRSGAP